MAYDKDLAVDLGKLVDAAYAQFNGVPNWQPPGYTISALFTAIEPWKSGPQTIPMPQFPPLNFGQFNVPQLPHFTFPQFSVPVLPAAVPFGYVATKGNDAFVVIRGTLTPLEWLADFTILQTPFNPGQNFGRTTQGFKSIYDQIGPTIIQSLQHLKSIGQANNIYVTGHSLGAALAILAAVDIDVEIKVKPVSYTFSGPRTGDMEFAKAYAAAALETYRIFNTEDLVPTVPLAAVELVGSNIGLTQNSQIEFVMQMLLKLAASGQFQHVGTPVPVSFHKGNIADNHNLTNTYHAL